MPDIFTSNEPTMSKNRPHQRLASHTEEGETINLPEGYDIHKHPNHTHNPLSSYCFYPDTIKYINLDKSEKTILFLRKHPITNIPWVILAFGLILLPPFFTLIPLFDKLPFAYIVIITLIWYLICTAFIIEKLLSWFFNIDLVTDERIMDVGFVNLMYREITEANLDEIQEVTFKPATGIFSFFHMGSVFIQTAAEVPRIEFRLVPNPEKVAKILRELRIQEEVEKLEGRIR